MIISLIAAMDRNRVIGRDNQLPWRLPEDLKRFKAITLGHPVLMGRKTFESIGRPLPGRRNFVISRQKEYRAEGVTVVYSLEVALTLCASEPEVFVIGGAEIYRLALPRADRLYLTIIEKEHEGDAHFPEWPRDEYREIAREEHLDASLPHRFLTLARA